MKKISQQSEWDMDEILYLVKDSGFVDNGKVIVPNVLDDETDSMFEERKRFCAVYSCLILRNEKMTIQELSFQLNDRL